jgi:hypothetical protein
MRLCFLFLLLFLWGCNKKIDLKLPAYESKLVIEMYLEPGKPFRCVLQESTSYLSPPGNPLMNNALVTVSYNGKQDTLINEASIDTLSQKRFNYTGKNKVVYDENTTFSLFAKDISGRTLRSVARFLRPVSIDSVTFAFDKEDTAQAAIFFRDPPGENFYRFYTSNQSRKREQTYRVNDLLFDGKPFTLFSNFTFARQDTVTFRLYHLTPEHYNFLESVQNARTANFNPFVQPSLIKSNVEGGIGVFTTVIYEERRKIVPKSP